MEYQFYFLLFLSGILLIILIPAWIYNAIKRWHWRLKFGKYTDSFDGDLNKWGYHALVLVNEDENKILLNDEIWDIDDIRNIETHDSGKSYIADGTKLVTDTGSMLGRAAIGGVIGGGVGAIIGGTTASKTEKTVYKELEESHYVKIESYKKHESGYFEDSPIHCYVNTANSKDTNNLYKFIAKIIEKHAKPTTTTAISKRNLEKLSKIFKNADCDNSDTGSFVNNDEEIEIAGSTHCEQSNVSELERLALLLDRGIITEDEFKQQKEKIFKSYT